MSAEVWTILSVGIALGGLVIALGGLMWRMLRSLRHDMERRFEQVDRQFAEVREKFEQVAECFREIRGLARLAEDHNGLARELSELRGEIRGRSTSAPAPPRLVPLHSTGGANEHGGAHAILLTRWSTGYSLSWLRQSTAFPCTMWWRPVGCSRVRHCR